MSRVGFNSFTTLEAVTSFYCSYYHVIIHEFKKPMEDNISHFYWYEVRRRYGYVATYAIACYPNSSLLSKLMFAHLNSYAHRQRVWGRAGQSPFSFLRIKKLCGEEKHLIDSPCYESLILSHVGLPL